MLFAVSLVVASYLNGPMAQEVSAEDLAFLAGHWRGELGDSVIEETWLPPVAGNLTGVFRMTGKDKVDLVEIMTLTETDGGVDYRLRHFDTALTPWASEADGPIVGTTVLIDEDSVRFNMSDPDTGVQAITYDREGDSLVGTVIFTDESRPPFALTFALVE
jgi:hypothetical protein